VAPPDVVAVLPLSSSPQAANTAPAPMAAPPMITWRRLSPPLSLSSIP
jgi:hypothetical protein